MEFPFDLASQIVRKLDIDSRRALGVYTKLKIPEALAKRISRTFIKTATKNMKSADNSLITMMMPFYDDDMKTFYLSIMDEDYLAGDMTEKARHVLLIIRSWFSTLDFEAPGLILRAGIPDGSENVHISYSILPYHVDYIEYGVKLANFDNVFDDS